LEQTRHEEALAAWMNATMLKPSHVSAWTNIIILLGYLGMFDILTLLSMSKAVIILYFTL